MDIRTIKDISSRIVALFLVSSLGTISGAAMFAPDLPIWKSAVLAGFAAVADVVQRLARYSLDGKLTLDEINTAFLGAESDEDETK